MAGGPNKRVFLDQPPSAESKQRGSASAQQRVNQGYSSEDSPGSLPLYYSLYYSSRQAPSVNYAADHRARTDGEEPSRQKGGPSLTACCPHIDQRPAPKRQDSQESTVPSRGGSHQREVNGNRQPAPKDRPAPGGRPKHPVAEAGDKPQSTSSWSLSNFLATFTSSGSPHPKSVKQGKADSRNTLTTETDKTLSKNNSLEPELKALRSSSHPQSSQFLQALEEPIQIVNELLDENQRLQQEVQELKTENQGLRQELEELRRVLAPERKSTIEETPVPQIIVFPVQVQRSGETGGCEKQFLRDVAKLLNGHKVSLQVEEYREGSEPLLLLFAPIHSREGTDIENALKGLKSTQKTLLVVFHHMPKNSTKFFADIKSQVQHPALVGAVRACFFVQDGFYQCQINQDAIESVAATIMRLTRDG